VGISGIYPPMSTQPGHPFMGIGTMNTSKCWAEGQGNGDQLWPMCLGRTLFCVMYVR